VRIRYDRHTARVQDTFWPAGAGGLLLGGAGLGFFLQDLVQGAFWGWGVSALILASLAVSAYICTCYRVILINRRRKLVTVRYRGWYGYQNSFSYFAPVKLESSLETFKRVLTTRRMERLQDSSGEVAVYTIHLEPDTGNRVSVLRSTSESLIEKEATKLAEFLGLPSRKGYESRP
jgi:hypothetical protein